MKATILALFLITAIVCDSCYKYSYGRGVGKPIHACAKGLEQSGLLCYPPCKEGYHGVGPVCWADHGIKSYGRGVGKCLQCSEEEDEDAALCYKKCTGLSQGLDQLSKFNPVGPVCWGVCPDSEPHVCGGCLCTKDADSCTEHMKTSIKDIFNAAVDFAKKAEGVPVPWSKILEDLGHVADDFTFAVCDNITWRFLLRPMQK